MCVTCHCSCLNSILVENSYASCAAARYFFSTNAETESAFKGWGGRPATEICIQQDRPLRWLINEGRGWDVMINSVEGFLRQPAGGPRTCTGRPVTILHICNKAVIFTLVVILTGVLQWYTLPACLLYLCYSNSVQTSWNELAFSIILPQTVIWSSSKSQ